MINQDCKVNPPSRTTFWKNALNERRGSERAREYGFQTLEKVDLIWED